MTCVSLRVFTCQCERATSCICLTMKGAIFFFFFLLWCGMPRSRCAGIQINSIECSLIVPLRHARKLKLMMERERKQMKKAWRAAEEDGLEKNE